MSKKEEIPFFCRKIVTSIQHCNLCNRKGDCIRNDSKFFGKSLLKKGSYTLHQLCLIPYNAKVRISTLQWANLLKSRDAKRWA